MFRITVLAVVTVLAAATSVPAEAKIACSKGYQMVNGQMIATPYCQDAYVADVAREHGMYVSAAEIRDNPNTKRYVCQFIGRDIRIYEACIQANTYGRRQF